MVKYIFVPEVFSFSTEVIFESRVELEIEIFLIILFLTFGICVISINNAPPSLYIVELIKGQLKSQVAGIQLSASWLGDLAWRMSILGAATLGLHAMPVPECCLHPQEPSEAWCSTKTCWRNSLGQGFSLTHQADKLLSDDFLGFEPIRLFNAKNNHAPPQTF